MDVPTRRIEDDRVVAGYLVTEQERTERTVGFPQVPFLLSAGDRLAERPPGQNGWYRSHQEALTARTPGHHSADTRLPALLVPVAITPRLVSDIRAAGAEEDFVLMENLTTRHQHAGGATLAGREVLGHDNGLMHSWLCNDLYRDAVTGR